MVLWPELTEASCSTLSCQPPPKLLPWEPLSASQHQATKALKCICEHLRFISLYSFPLHPLQGGSLKDLKSLREVIFLVCESLKIFPYKLMKVASLLYIIQLTKGFIGPLCFP